jgi:signal peptidase I
MERSNVFFYFGASMKGTFRIGDCLIVEPVSLNDISLGDVVVFCKSERPSNNQVVHRVVKIVPGGLITRGDFNRIDDVLIVLEENLVGRVTYFERNGKRHPVQNGWQGWLRGQILHFWHPFWRKTWRYVIAPVGRREYRWLRDSGLVGNLWHPSVTKVYLETKQGPLVKYICNNQTVAYWWPKTNCFKCRKPYDLVLRREKIQH